MYLIFDTETTGFYNPKLNATSAGQARIAQLAAVKLDANFNEVGRINTLIKPSGHWKMSEGAQGIHGISQQDCELRGRELEDVLNELWELSKNCTHLVCHNQNFDGNLLKIEDECSQYFLTAGTSWWPRNSVCTMDLMTPICKLPFATGRPKYGQKYKWPKLEEALSYIGGKTEGNFHDAMCDTLACAEVFKWLIKNNKIKGINYDKHVDSVSVGAVIN